MPREITLPRPTTVVPWFLLALVGIGFAAFPECNQPDCNHVEPGLPSTAAPPSAGFAIAHASYTGAISCAAASCHGGDAHTVGGEYATWIANDPHKKAYMVLYNEVSEKIARNLASLKPDGKEIPAHKDALCLKCHSLPVEPAFDQHGIVRQGVSCEGCHGPAEHYLTTHFQGSFKALSVQDKAEQYGLYPTKDIGFRAVMCASCHVGDASREVNHDLIAAGHPRLMFEFSAYHEHPKYGKHWTEKASPSDFEVRSWAIGQAAVIKSSLDLLEARLKTEKAPWPEFTEYSCYACHQEIGTKSHVWKDVSKWEHAPGKMAWGTWTLPVLNVVANEVNLTGGAVNVSELQKLRELMETRPLAKDEIKAQTGKAKTQIEQLLASLRQTGGRDAVSRPFTQHASLFSKLAGNGLTPDQKQFNNLDWDGVTQHYLGLAAIYRAWNMDRPANIKPAMEDLRGKLYFQPGYDSPKGLEPKTVFDKYKKLFDLIPKVEGKP